MFFSISCIGTWPGPSIMTCTSFFHALRVRSPSVRSCEDSAELLLRRLDFQRSKVSSGHLNLCVPRPVLDGADVDAIPKEPGGKRAAKSFQIPLFAFVSGHAPMTSTAVQPGAARRTLQRPREMGVRQISIGSKYKTGLRILLVPRFQFQLQIGNDRDIPVLRVLEQYRRCFWVPSSISVRRFSFLMVMLLWDQWQSVRSRKAISCSRPSVFR
jgi:hypothetical protein